jgi:beta-lactamase superfamily II metal-dependent hydrolase
VPLAVLLLAGLASAQPAPPPTAESGARGLRIYWVDVEGGAATLLVTPAGESILVDSGWPEARDAERIQRVAAEAGVERIDHLVTTHWHRDHFGGVAELARRLPIGAYYDHGFPDGAPRDIQPELKEAYLRVTGGRSTVLRPGDRLTLRQAAGPPLDVRVVTSHGLVEGEDAGAAQTRACATHAGRPDDASDNHRSVGLLVTYGAFEFLDLGDLTWNVEHKLVCPTNRLGAVDVYQVTHHGLDSSNNPDLVRAVRPAVAVVNNGPRKGGKPAVYRTLTETPAVEAVFQVHRNVETGADENAVPAHVANDDEACEGHGIRLVVDPDVKHYTVAIPAKGTARRFAVR